MTAEGGTGAVGVARQSVAPATAALGRGAGFGVADDFGFGAAFGFELRVAGAFPATLFRRTDFFAAGFAGAVFLTGVFLAVFFAAGLRALAGVFFFVAVDLAFDGALAAGRAVFFLAAFDFVLATFVVALAFTPDFLARTAFAMTLLPSLSTPTGWHPPSGMLAHIDHTIGAS